MAEHGSPAFLLDEADLRRRCRDYREAFGGAMVYYAAKAFLCTAVARWVEEEGLGLDVCTGGELAVALRAGFPGERMLLHGNNKSVAELAAALDAGVGRVVVDSLRRDRPAGRACAPSAASPQRVLVRATVGVEAHTHEFIATAHEDQKFGFSLAGGDAPRGGTPGAGRPGARAGRPALPHRLADLRHRRLRGRRPPGASGCWRRSATSSASSCPSSTSAAGSASPTRAPTTRPTSSTWAARCAAIVERECAAYGLAVPSLAIEPGRGIVGPGTVTVYEVGTVKAVEGRADLRLASTAG